MTIIEEESDVVMFVNNAAKVFKVEPNEEFKISLNRDNDNTFDSRVGMLARVAPELLHVDNDSELNDNIQKIIDLDDYISMEAVIKEQSNSFEDHEN